MASAKVPVKPPKAPTIPTLDWFQVKGFKSHRAGSRIGIRPLTVLAGANSSGKSSVMQPLLLLKQTLHEDRYDPGPLKLDGPNVIFSDPSQFFTRKKGPKTSDILELTLGLDRQEIRLRYKSDRTGVALLETGVTIDQASEIVLAEGQAVSYEDAIHLVWGFDERAKFIARRNGIAHALGFGKASAISRIGPHGALPVRLISIFPVQRLSRDLLRMVHLSGHRGNPSRRYPRSVNSEAIKPGLFHEQAAGLIAHWKQHKDPSLSRLQSALRTVGLGWKVEPIDVDATTIDLHISRTREGNQGGAKDLVSIADVGFGVSQSLPVLVALIDAKPEQLVYIEQPEIHLHPRAQIGVADLIVEAAKRGARVIIETHSEIILTRIQYRIAKGDLPAKDVWVHWFSSDPKSGDTTVTSVEPDDTGAFGDWPVDFASVGEQVDREYVNAAWARQAAIEE